MKRKLFTSIALVLVIATTAWASVKFYNSSDSDLGHINYVKCSTGLTCTKSSTTGILSMVAEPTTFTGANGESIVNSTDDTVRIQSDDASFVLDLYSPFATNGTVSIRLIGDAGADVTDRFQIQNDAGGNLTFGNDSAEVGTYVTKLTLSSDGHLTVTGDVSGDGGDQLVGFLQNQVAATATTLTAAQCGSTFISGGAVEVELPAAAGVLGCRYTFIVNAAANFTIDPNGTDQILLLTNAGGDSLIADAAGESLVIEAIATGLWAPIGAEKGTWTDSN